MIVLIEKEQINNNTSNIIIDFDKNIVSKVINYAPYSRELFYREVYWLKKLQHTKLVPKLVDTDIEKFKIVMSYCGEILTHENEPNDVYKQLYDINLMLLQNNCMYNDWKHGNVLVKEGKLYIIDFGWCSEIIEDFSCGATIDTDLSIKPGGGNFFQDVFIKNHNN